ncbi:MAG: tetratricopeptide repeat protein [Bacillota bacterium]
MLGRFFDNCGVMLLLRRRSQKIVFWTLVIFISAGLIGSSVVWSGLTGAPAPRAPVAQEKEGAQPQMPDPEKEAGEPPRDVSTALRLGAAYLERGDLDRAAAAYRKALEFDSRNTAARLSLAEIYLAQKKTEAALAELNDVLATNPDHLAALYRRGIILGLVKGDKDAAAADLERFVRLAGSGPEVEHARSLLAAWRAR